MEERLGRIWRERSARARKDGEIPTQAPDCPRLRTAIGKEIEGMIERWKIDWIGFGERGAQERDLHTLIYRKQRGISGFS